MCGAASGWSDGICCVQGLSPRVWGSRGGIGEQGKAHRSIPTCVGQPLMLSRCSVPKAVYPHVCGAAEGMRTKRSPEEGLSPRVWGSRRIRRRSWLWYRSIPTCVGQPMTSATKWKMLSVYPHVCGAADVQGRARAFGSGLSPRVWGSPLLLVWNPSLRRSIPTCVGQPAAGYAHWRQLKVYPHVCGAASPAPLRR